MATSFPLSECESFSLVLQFVDQSVRLRMSSLAWSSPSPPFARPHASAAFGVVALHLLIGLAWWLVAAVPASRQPPQTALAVQLLADAPRPLAESPRLPRPTPPRRPWTAPIDLPHIAINVIADAPPPAPTSPAAVLPPQPAVTVAPLAPPPAASPPPPPPVLQAQSLRYRVSPAVEVPLASRRLGESGTVLLHVLVDAQGLPARVEVRRSSGHARLDAQALAAMRAARFEPCTHNGRPVACEADAPIAYELEP
jgi:protein TonB